MDSRSIWTHPEDDAWLGLSARLQPIAARLAARTNLIVRIRPGAGPLDEAPIWDYRHPGAEVVLDARVVLRPLVDDPSAIDPRSALDRARHPRLFGALCAAAAHARHTRWALPGDLAPSLEALVANLETARVLSAFLVDRSAYRTWLRGACELLVTTADPSRTAGHARAVGVIGLQSAGILDESEVAPLRHALGIVLGSARLARLDEAIDEARGLPDGDLDALLDVARRIADLLPAATGAATDGAESTDDADGQSLLAPAGAALGAAATTAAALAGSAAGTGQSPSGRRASESEIDRRAIASSAFRMTFRSPDAPIAATIREPTPELVARARTLAAMLRAARHRIPTAATAPSRTPPGRLQLGEAMRREAQRAARVELTARPWLQTRRRHVDPPVLRVGLSWDTSRSREAHQAYSADLAWALAWAVARVQGRLAAVSWSSSARPVVWPGRTPTRVVEPVCNGGSTGCPQSLRALDGALLLTGSTGPRVVVVVTDGRQPNRRHIRDEVDGLIDGGVRVLWVTESQLDWAPNGADHVALAMGEDAVTTLGSAICGIFMAAAS